MVKTGCRVGVLLVKLLWVVLGAGGGYVDMLLVVDSGPEATGVVGVVEMTGVVATVGGVLDAKELVELLLTAGEVEEVRPELLSPELEEATIGRPVVSGSIEPATVG